MVNVTEPLSLDPIVYVVVYVLPDPDTALLETGDPPTLTATIGVFMVSLAVILSVITSFSFASVEVALLEDKSTTVNVGTVVSTVTAELFVVAVTCVALFPAVSDASSVNVTEPLSLDPTVYVVVYVVPDPDTALLETVDSPIFIAIVGVVIVSLAVTLIVIISPSFANVEVALLEDRSTRVNVGIVLSFTDAVLLDCVVDDAFPVASKIDVVDAGTIVNVSAPSGVPDIDKLKS